MNEIECIKQNLADADLEILNLRLELDKLKRQYHAELIKHVLIENSILCNK